MAKSKTRRLGFQVDKMSNSIEHVRTGKVFATRLVQLYPSDAALLTSLKWQFDWTLELQNPLHEVSALTTVEEPEVIQGIISMVDQHDHVFIPLIESAPFNIGAGKEYTGVPSNLVAYACFRSLRIGYDGVVAFVAKSRLVEHYENTLGAKRFAGNRMFIETEAADRLIRNYLKNFDEEQLQEIG